jgi:hypothetical protein
MVVHRRGWRVGVAVGVVVVGLVGVATAWATLFTPQPVVTAKGLQIRPSAALGGAYLAYSQSRPGHPKQYDVYVKTAGTPRFKVNKRGQAFGGGIDGTTLIWQSVINGQSDLRLFHLASHTRSVPAGVNTRRWEFWPTMSAGWILYGQRWGHRPRNWRVILHNKNTHETRILDERVNRPHTEVDPGQVNGDYATWETYNSRTGLSNAFLYQISTATTTKLPRPTGKVQYYPSVTPAGTVFYLRSGVGYCNHAVLREYAAGVDTPVAVLPRGSDVATNPFAVDEGGGVTSVYYDGFKCSTGKTHIYKLTVS